jgi:hypothetical protein
MKTPSSWRYLISIASAAIVAATFAVAGCSAHKDVQYNGGYVNNAFVTTSTKPPTVMTLPSGATLRLPPGAPLPPPALAATLAREQAQTPAYRQ